MTKEDKQLLLQDLCARLPYGVNFQLHNSQGNTFDFYIGVNTSNAVGKLLMLTDNCKPYLRPMSSITDEERIEMREYCDSQPRLIHNIGVAGQIHSPNVIDFLNTHHFDYRGLIEKGLALEAPEGMYSV